MVAKDGTSLRFPNVISLLNGMVPLTAIQIRARPTGGKFGLLFTTAVDLLTLGPVGEDEELQEATDRACWESQVRRRRSLWLTMS